MSEQRVFEGKDLDEALREAAENLGIAPQDLHYEILEQGRRGVFGLGAKSVRIRVMRPVDQLADHEILGRELAGPPPAGEAPRPRPPRRPRRPRAQSAGGERPRSEARARPSAGPVSEEVAAEIERTLARMLELAGLELTTRLGSHDAGVELELEGADRKLLLQKDAELLVALQFLLNRMSRRSWPEAGRIHLACDGERQRRDEDVVELTREVAQQVARTGRPKRLHPMNAYERRLVHLTVREFAGVTSRSEGEGTLKRVRILPERRRRGELEART